MWVVSPLPWQADGVIRVRWTLVGRETFSVRSSCHLSVAESHSMSTGDGWRLVVAEYVRGPCV